MEKIDIILWILGGGFTAIFGLMIVMWNSLNNRIDGVEGNLGKRIDKLDEKVAHIDRRLTIVETRMGFIEKLLEMGGYPFKNQDLRTDP